MSKLQGSDDYGRIVWCNWRKPLNDPTWAGCGHWALEAVPAGTCNRLFDPNHLKLCTSGASSSVVGGIAVGAKTGFDVGRTVGPEGALAGGVAGALAGGFVSPAMNAATNSESCTAVNTIDNFADDDAYCPIPKGLKDNPTKENARKFGLSCMSNNSELTPTPSCSDIKLEDYNNDSGRTSTACVSKWSMGVDVDESPYMQCIWDGANNKCTTGISMLHNTCTFNWDIMRESNGDNFSALRALETGGDKYTYCDYDDSYVSYAPECPAENKPGCPELDRTTYDFDQGTAVIYCGKDDNSVKCADHPSKVNALVIGSNSKLASCPCGYTEDGFVENPDDDDCVGMDIWGHGDPCTYRKCNLIAPTDT